MSLKLLSAKFGSATPLPRESAQKCGNICNKSSRASSEFPHFWGVNPIIISWLRNDFVEIWASQKFACLSFASIALAAGMVCAFKCVLLMVCLYVWCSGPEVRPPFRPFPWEGRWQDSHCFADIFGLQKDREKLSHAYLSIYSNMYFLFYDLWAVSKNPRIHANFGDLSNGFSWEIHLGLRCCFLMPMLRCRSTTVCKRPFRFYEL